MFCGQCGGKFTEDEKFCITCGCSATQGGPATQPAILPKHPNLPKPDKIGTTERIVRVLIAATVASLLMVAMDGGPSRFLHGKATDSGGATSAGIVAKPDTETWHFQPDSEKWEDYQVRLRKIAKTIDYTKPLFTRDHAVLCPPYLFVDRDPREGHSPTDIMGAYFDESSARGLRAEEVGCQEWHAGVEVEPLESAVRQDPEKFLSIIGMTEPEDSYYVFVRVGRNYFMTFADEVTNDPSGKIRTSG
jgi:hypothetical protein